MPTKVFSLPEYEATATTFMFATINDLMRRTDSVLNQVPFHDVADLPKSQVTTKSGEVVKTDEVLCEMQFSVALSDSVNGNLEGFATSMSAAAESGLKSLMPQIFNSISQVCTATGNTVSTGPEGFTHEIFLQMLEGLDIRFDDKGKHNLSWVMSPEMFEKLSKLPPPTPEQNKAVEKLLERKRDEFFKNKRRRQLSHRASESDQ